MFFRVALTSLLTYWAWKTVDIIQSDAEFASEWDPYKVLHLEDNGEFDSKAIRESYRRLSKKWHPDKVNWS